MCCVILFYLWEIGAALPPSSRGGYRGHGSRPHRVHTFTLVRGQASLMPDNANTRANSLIRPCITIIILPLILTCWPSNSSYLVCTNIYIYIYIYIYNSGFYYPPEVSNMKYCCLGVFRGGPQTGAAGANRVNARSGNTHYKSQGDWH